jgi:hypothetical protein
MIQSKARGDAETKGRVPEMRTLTLRLVDGSTRWMEGGDELQIAISGGLLRKGNFKFSPPQPPLDAILPLEVLRVEALLLDSFLSSSSLPIDDVV